MFPASVFISYQNGIGGQWKEWLIQKRLCSNLIRGGVAKGYNGFNQGLEVATLVDSFLFRRGVKLETIFIVDKTEYNVVSSLLFLKRN